MRSWLAVAVGGERGERMSERCNMALCESKTPWLQVPHFWLLSASFKAREEPSLISECVSDYI